MHILGKRNPEKLIDLLAERLEFEAASVKLYDAVLEKLRASRDPMASRIVPTFVKHRNEEEAHRVWLESQIRALGGTVNPHSALVELVHRESSGIEEIVANDDRIPHLLHAIFAAELLDGAGWDLLIELADDADDTDALRELERRKNDEEEHLIYVRSALAAIARDDVLGGESRIVGESDRL